MTMHGDVSHDSEIPRSFVSTYGMPRKAAVEFWQERVSGLLDTQLRDPEGEGAFSQIDAYMLGRLSLSKIDIGPQLFSRSLRKIGQDGLDHYFLSFYETGCCRNRIDRFNTESQPGDLIITDLSQPLSAEVTKHSSIDIVLPRAILASKLSFPNDQHMRIVHRDEPLVRILRSHLATLANTAVGIKQRDVDNLEPITVSLIAAAMNGCGTEQTRPAIHTSIRSTIVVFIDNKLNNADLTPEYLSKHFGISLRKLHYLFQVDGGVSKFIQLRRLYKIKDMLTRPEMAGASIAEIAQCNGFSHTASFSRAFRKAFGVSARTIRAMSLEGQKLESALGSNGLSWSGWLQQMKYYSGSR
ncbi:AraC family transcriptional regulator [Gallaecimonas xiamenensis 3-C-1]|uniref:AraC family transcriptional regulator n=1 Tax=Gallaecimonas xiamenensis 3-C-1 TaxID=745411 RepID=K2J5T0_9GAMM|nr:AraC family transcriptional regulator [Gallaecimonas xiamenensis 3-C-1]